MEAIASSVQCFHSALFKPLKRFKESGSVDDRPRSGQARDDREFVRINLRKRRFTSILQKREWNETSLVSCSSRTVRRRLDDAGLGGWPGRSHCQQIDI